MRRPRTELGVAPYTRKERVERKTLSAVWENCWRKRDEAGHELVHAATAVTVGRFHDVVLRLFFISWAGDSLSSRHVSSCDVNACSWDV
jgi:hypothetical protein